MPTVFPSKDVKLISPPIKDVNQQTFDDNQSLNIKKLHSLKTLYQIQTNMRERYLRLKPSCWNSFFDEKYPSVVDFH